VNHTFIAKLLEARRQAKSARYRLSRYCRDHKCSYKECCSSKEIPEEYSSMVRQSNRLKRIEAMVTAKLRLGSVSLRLDYPIVVLTDDKPLNQKNSDMVQDLDKKVQLLTDEVANLTYQLKAEKVLYANLARSSYAEKEDLYKELAQEKKHKNYFVHLSSKYATRIEELEKRSMNTETLYNDSESGGSSVRAGNYFQPIAGNQDHPSSSRKTAELIPPQVKPTVKATQQQIKSAGAAVQQPSDWVTVGAPGWRAEARKSGLPAEDNLQLPRPEGKRSSLTSDGSYQNNSDRKPVEGPRINPSPRTSNLGGVLPGSTRRPDGKKGARKASNLSSQGDWRSK